MKIFAILVLITLGCVTECHHTFIGKDIIVSHIENKINGSRYVFRTSVMTRHWKHAILVSFMHCNHSAHNISSEHIQIIPKGETSYHRWLYLNSDEDTSHYFNYSTPPRSLTRDFHIERIWEPKTQYHYIIPNYSRIRIEMTYPEKSFLKTCPIVRYRVMDIVSVGREEKTQTCLYTWCDNCQTSNVSVTSVISEIYTTKSAINLTSLDSQENNFTISRFRTGRFYLSTIPYSMEIISVYTYAIVVFMRLILPFSSILCCKSGPMASEFINVSLTSLAMIPNSLVVAYFYVMPLQSINEIYCYYNYVFFMPLYIGMISLLPFSIMRHLSMHMIDAIKNEHVKMIRQNKSPKNSYVRCMIVTSKMISSRVGVVFLHVCVFIMTPILFILIHLMHTNGSFLCHVESDELLMVVYTIVLVAMVSLCIPLVVVDLALVTSKFLRSRNIKTLKRLFLGSFFRLRFYVIGFLVCVPVFCVAYVVVYLFDNFFVNVASASIIQFLYIFFQIHSVQIASLCACLAKRKKRNNTKAVYEHPISSIVSFHLDSMDTDAAPYSLYELFEKFCNKEYSIENLMLYTEIQRIKRSCLSNEDSKIPTQQILSSLQSIKVTYCSGVTSPLEVNLRGAVLSRFEKEYLGVIRIYRMGAPDSEIRKTIPLILEGLEKEMIFNLEDTHSRFVHTKDYMSLSLSISEMQKIKSPYSREKDPSNHCKTDDEDKNKKKIVRIVTDFIIPVSRLERNRGNSKSEGAIVVGVERSGSSIACPVDQVLISPRQRLENVSDHTVENSINSSELNTVPINTSCTSMLSPKTHVDSIDVAPIKYGDSDVKGTVDLGLSRVTSYNDLVIEL